MTNPRAVLLASLLALALAGLATAADKLPLVFSDDFQKGAEAWQPSDAGAWKVIEADGKKAYSQFQQSKYKPAYRSPLNFALVKDVVVGDFEFTVKAKSTCRDYNHRDLCVFFGYQGPSRYYYAHLGKKADDRCNQVFIVNDAARAKITKTASDGIPWDEKWHDIKVVRRVADGTIEVYFDDMTKPTHTAVDKTFTWGQVGLGSFDDTGDFMEFKLYGQKVERPQEAK